MKQILTKSPNECASCGALLQGKYCHLCGEKHLNSKYDFSLLHFLKETFESFTHLDSRVLRTFGLLFTRPGLLTAEFIAGRRVRYLKPIPLFLIAGLLFYLFFGHATAFFSSVGDMSRGYVNRILLTNTFHVDTETLFAAKAASLDLDQGKYLQEMTQQAAHLSKTWLFLIVPFWGILVWSFFRRKIPWLVPHLIFALHGMTFFILFDLFSLFFLVKILGFNASGNLFVYYLMLVFMIYNIIAVRRVYGLSKLKSFLAGTGVLMLFLLILIIYRQSIILWILMT